MTTSVRSTPIPRVTAVTRGIVGSVAFVVLLEAAVRAGLIGSASLPLPSEVLARTFEMLVDSAVWSEILATMKSWALGLLVAGVAGIGLGMLLGSWRLLARMSRGPIELLRPLPAVAIAPLLLSLLGRGVVSRSLAVAYAALWPILFNTIYGMRSVDPVAKETARSFGLGSFGVLTRVTMPAMSPFVFTGLRVASAIALIVAVSVEFLLPGGDDAGLGGIVVEAQVGGDLLTMYATVVIAGLLGLATNAVLVAIERRAFGWRRGLAQ
jgi:NitT/TauT family transport system permease protein